MYCLLCCSGPWVGQLLSTGEPVTIDGKLIRPEDIMQPPEPSQTLTGRFLIICSVEYFLRPLRACIE